jgi:hypothetical protein
MDSSPAENGDEIGPLNAFTAAFNSVTDGIIVPEKTREVRLFPLTFYGSSILKYNHQ